MNNMDVWIMVLSRERERQIRQYAEESRTQRALLERPLPPDRRDRCGALWRTWHVVAALRRIRWREPEPRRDECAPCATAADELLVEV